MRAIINIFGKNDKALPSEPKGVVTVTSGVVSEVTVTLGREKA